jgi:hypothetical protein
MAAMHKCDGTVHQKSIVEAYVSVAIRDHNSRYEITDNDYCRDCLSTILSDWKSGSLRKNKTYSITLL